MAIICGQDLGNDPKPPCLSGHCTGFQETSAFHQYCQCLTWDGKKIDGCEIKSSNFPIPSSQCIDSNGQELKIAYKDPKGPDGSYAKQCIKAGGDWQECYCCCTCFAYGTPIAIPEGTKVIQDFQVGDQVLVAIPAVTDTQLQLSWSPKTVGFSSGTGPKSHEAIMVYLHYGDKGALIVTTDQLFLMPNGKLKRADKLVPGQDELVLADGGTTTPLHEVRLGSYDGGVHHIATSTESLEDFTGIDDHLLNSNGVVTGDYILQLYQNTDKMKDWLVDNHEQHPTIGSRLYAAIHTHLHIENSFAKHPDTDFRNIAHESFSPYGKGISPIPENAQHFITKAQEGDILHPQDSQPQPKATIRPFSNKAGVSTIEYLFKLYNAFYPEVIFYLDWENERPNAFSFEEYGRKIVVVCGGLVRLDGLYMEGLAIILAHELGHLYGGDPSEDHGSCQGQADYFGIGVILRNVWYLDLWFDIVKKGMDQIRRLFSYISEENAKGNEKDVCNYPSISCRLEAMELAISGLGDLPACAGGPTPGGLKVESAEVMEKDGKQSDGKQSIVVTFNEAVSPYTAENPNRYTLEPKTVISSAKLNPEDKSKVILAAELQPESEYILTVSYVRAFDGSTLDPESSTVTFKLA